MRVQPSISCLLLSAFCLLPPVALAGTGAWTSNGPYGGIIEALAIDPSSPQTIYAGTLLGGVSVITLKSVLSSDFNGDGVANLDDFFAFAERFNTRRGDPRFDPRFDLDGDGAVGFGDFFIFAASW